MSAKTVLHIRQLNVSYSDDVMTTSVSAGSTDNLSGRGLAQLQQD